MVVYKPKTEDQRTTNQRPKTKELQTKDRRPKSYRPKTKELQTKDQRSTNQRPKNYKPKTEDRRPKNYKPKTEDQRTTNQRPKTKELQTEDRRPKNYKPKTEDRRTTNQRPKTKELIEQVKELQPLQCCENLQSGRICLQLIFIWHIPLNRRQPKICKTMTCAIHPFHDSDSMILISIPISKFKDGAPEQCLCWASSFESGIVGNCQI